MALFKRRKKDRTPEELQSLVDQAIHNVTTPVRSNHPRFSLNHGFMDGDEVECAVGGEQLVVRIITHAALTIALEDAWKGVALICDDCGRLFCLDCALRQHPHLPTCDRCKRVGSVNALMK